MHARRRAAYILPSAFTIGNILLGFFAIIMALRGRFVVAAVCIMVAGVVDTLDGRLARMLGTESDFGKEFDSLADVLTFGLSPGLVAHLWGIDAFPRLGWLVPLYYLVCCATRLARFNVQTARLDSRWFVGLPSPAAAGSIASFILLVPHPDGSRVLLLAMLAVLATVGTLMVSTFRYWSFKSIDLRKPRSYRVALPIAACVVVLAFYPEAFLPALSTVYAASGPVQWLVGRLRSPRDPSSTDSGDNPESSAT
ncbi:MAG: CDP-diacylglycerol--serine O-phosphatidyltransferase [Thermoanaerobaculia bacterium]